MVTSAVILLPYKAAALSMLGLSLWCDNTLWLWSQSSDALQGSVFPAVFFTLLWNTLEYIVEHVRVHYVQSNSSLQIFAVLIDGLSPWIKRICRNLLLRWSSPELEDMKRDHFLYRNSYEQHMKWLWCDLWSLRHASYVFFYLVPHDLFSTDICL